MDIAKINSVPVRNREAIGYFDKLDQAAKFEVSDIDEIPESETVTNHIIKMYRWLNQINWTDPTYGNAGISIRPFQEKILNARTNHGEEIRTEIVEKRESKLHAKFPTDVDPTVIGETPKPYLEAWILELLLNIGPISRGRVSLDEFQTDPQRFKAIMSVFCYRYAEGHFLKESELIRVNVAVKEANDVKSAYHANLGDIRRTTEAQKEQYERRMTRIDADSEKWEEQVEHAIDRADTFSKYKGLEGYYTSKATRHNRAYSGFLYSFFISMFVIVGTIYTKWEFFVGNAPIFGNGNFEYGKAILFAIPLILALWILRILLRHALVHLRLGEDAQNKAVMLRTYSVLEAHHGDKVKDQERAIIFNAIFRPTMGEEGVLDIAPTTLGDVGRLFKGT